MPRIWEKQGKMPRIDYSACSFPISWIVRIIYTAIVIKTRWCASPPLSLLILPSLSVDIGGWKIIRYMETREPLGLINNVRGSSEELSFSLSLCLSKFFPRRLLSSIAFLSSLFSLDGWKIGGITGDYLCKGEGTRAHESIAEAPRECSPRIDR